MHRITGWALALFLTAPTPQSNVLEGFDSQTETEHFVFAWRVRETDETAVAYAKTRAEEYFAALEKLLGNGPASRQKIAILFEGDARLPDGTWAVPGVDADGRVHLYRFGPSAMDYFGVLAHELVHAFRMRKSQGADGFLEEGFAEYVAEKVDPEISGFPRYGVPLTVAAGQWLGGDEEIPLPRLRAEHDALNLRCKAQSYTLRASFLGYLARSFGERSVLRLMNEEEHPGELAHYRKIFGRDFEELVADWRRNLKSRFDVFENGQVLARRYREGTAIRSMYICRKGRDF